MATGALRFRTPHIEEIPTTQSRRAPGFAWIAESRSSEDPAKNWGTTNRKRARASLGGQTEQQREALSASQQRHIDKRIRDLNSDNSTKEVVIPKEGTGNASTKAGKTSNTKKILASGKTFAHFLDDEEAEIARVGKDVEPAVNAQRPSKAPLSRRRTIEDTSIYDSPGSSSKPMAPPPLPRYASSAVIDVDMDMDDEDQDDMIPPLPSEAEIEALLNVPPLTYAHARSAPPTSGPPPRRFCESCGYWGRAKCMKCGAMTCSVVCKDLHDGGNCAKMYA